MNLKLALLALVVFAIHTHTPLADNTKPTFYGKVNVSFNQNDFEEVSTTTVVQDKDNWTLNSNASRLGVKGSATINDKLIAVYQMEYEIFVDDGSSSNNDEFSQRNIFVGLKGDWGQLIAGKNDTPLKLAQGKIDRFNDLDRGDIKYVMVGENRMSNIIMYTSPKFSGFTVKAAFIPGEDSADSGTDDGLADQISLAINYKVGGLYLSAAIDDNVKNTDTVRLVGEYSFADFKIAGLYQTSEQHAAAMPISSIKDPIGDITSNYQEQDAYLVSGQWKLQDHIIVKAQLVCSKSSPLSLSGIDDTEATQIAVGADYKLNKKTKLYTYYSQIEAQADNNLADGDVTDATFAVGFELKF